MVSAPTTVRWASGLCGHSATSPRTARRPSSPRPYPGRSTIGSRWSRSISSRSSPRRLVPLQILAEIIPATRRPGRGPHQQERTLSRDGGTRDASRSEGCRAGVGSDDRRDGGRSPRDAGARRGVERAGIELHAGERGRLPDRVRTDALLPEFPAPIYLTTRPDLGDVSRGRLVTTDNYYELFNGILNPKQLEGLRLLVTPFAQQQFNLTADRRSERPSLGVSCFDCHQNGSTNGATHLVGDIRPQQFRHRIETPTLRGVNIQRLFGSQRGLKTVEDFTEFEQRAAYFDGDPVIATKKGVNVLERGSQIHDMAEFQEILDFPPAPKLDVFGKLDPKRATEAELRGQALFFGKAQCAACHTPPYYTDNLVHNLRAERFYRPQMVNGMMASADGPVKTFPLRGIKDTPPYLHDGRLLTLDDTVEFFNLVLGRQLTADEKLDLAAFLRAL